MSLYQELKKRIEKTKQDCNNAAYVPVPTEMALSILAKLKATEAKLKIEETEAERNERKLKEFLEDDGA